MHELNMSREELQRFNHEFLSLRQTIAGGTRVEETDTDKLNVWVPKGDSMIDSICEEWNT